MKSILLASALALGVMTTGHIALAEPLKTLTNDQLDSFTAGRRVEDTQVFRGNSNNEVEGADPADTPPGWKTTTSSRNPGNPDNTNCNDCGDTTMHPNK